MDFANRNIAAACVRTKQDQSQVVPQVACEDIVKPGVNPQVWASRSLTHSHSVSTTLRGSSSRPEHLRYRALRFLPSALKGSFSLWNLSLQIPLRG